MPENKFQDEVDNYRNKKARMVELKIYLNKNWQSLADHFTERLIARMEYDKLEQELLD